MTWWTVSGAWKDSGEAGSIRIRAAAPHVAEAVARSNNLLVSAVTPHQIDTTATPTPLLAYAGYVAGTFLLIAAACLLVRDMTLVAALQVRNGFGDSYIMWDAVIRAGGFILTLPAFVGGINSILLSSILQRSSR